MARWQFTKLAAALVRDGVAVDLVMADAAEGCAHAASYLRRYEVFPDMNGGQVVQFNKIDSTSTEEN